MVVKGKLNDKKCFRHTGIKRPAKVLAGFPENSRDRVLAERCHKPRYQITCSTRAVSPPAQRQGLAVLSPSRAAERCPSEKGHQDVHGRQRSVLLQAMQQLQGSALNFHTSHLV